MGGPYTGWLGPAARPLRAGAPTRSARLASAKDRHTEWQDLCTPEGQGSTRPPRIAPCRLRARRSTIQRPGIREPPQQR